MISNSFVRFALVGLANTAVGYAVILLLHYGFGASAVAANVGGYAIGVLLSYRLNRGFTFSSIRPHAQALPRFGVAFVVCFGLNLLVLQVGVLVLGLSVAVAQALAVCAYSMSFYVASRFFVFRN